LDEYGCTFSPDGKQFYFTRTFVNPRKHVILVSKLEEKGWTQPCRVGFSKCFSQGEPQFAPDGKKLFFGQLERSTDNKLIPYIWVVYNRDGILVEPKRLTAGMYATAAMNGNLYYTDVSGGMEKGEMVFSVFKDGSHHPAKNLGGSLNSDFQDAHPFVAADESYIIFDSDRPGGLGNNDLYIGYKNKDGSWGKAINLGAPINSDKYDAIPYVSPDGKYLFFYRDGDIYWVNAKIYINKNRFKEEKIE
jgi:Tol biopolymer transport system component